MRHRHVSITSVPAWQLEYPST
nr:unnamed protein product [Callosobruchus chinensis]